MNLTQQPVYQKQPKSKHPRKYNAEEKAHCEKVRALPCIISNHECDGRTTLHHTGTGAGGRKNHMRVLPLCIVHHLGDRGIDSLTGAMSRREWEQTYGTEKELLEKLEEKLCR